MGIFHFFRRKPKLSESQNALMDKMAVLLFGGLEQMQEQISELYEMFDHRYNKGQIANALTWMTSRFSREGDMSAFALVDEGLLHRMDNPFNRTDAMVLYKYAAKKSLHKFVPNASESIFDEIFITLGNNPKGATSDVIPGAYGEYGLCVTNPIPTRGIPSNETYLQKLSLLSDEPFHWERVASFEAPNIENPIDGYDIISEKGEKLCTIYISPYQNVISNTAPKGFYIK